MGKTDKPDIGWTLRRIFGKSDFRPVQQEIILAALDKHDIFIQAATSFGKSLCFQLPAVIDHGITIVVSPLLALMTNQVAALRAAGIEAATINSTTVPSERQLILRDLECGHPRTRLLYVTPEYCSMDHFRRHLHIVHQQRELSRIAIDEAHCISEWGHDFRPSFKQLSFFKQEFPDVPIMCLTATATPRVRNDIIQTLGLQQPQQHQQQPQLNHQRQQQSTSTSSNLDQQQQLKTFTMTTSRPNIHFEMRFKSDETDQFDDFLSWIHAVYRRRRDNPERRAQLEAQGCRMEAVSGIIYTWFRRDCEVLAARLCANGVGAKPYHAGLSNAEKEDHLRGWIADEVGYDIIVATTAFGMGIDKENVRFVTHWQIPKSFEGFYQEAGRAGRDGRAALSIMYYSREDHVRAMQLQARDRERSDKKNPSEAAARAASLEALVAYCESTTACRHEMISQYFGDVEAPECDYACDYCKDAAALGKAKSEGLADEEWVSTQRESGALGGGGGGGGGGGYDED